MMASVDEIFVIAHENEINNNNNQNTPGNPFKFIELNTGQPFQRALEVTKGLAQCDLCFQTFQNFSALYKHKAKLCYEDAVTTQPFPNPIKIIFPEAQLVYIEDALKGLGIDISNEEDNSRSFIVDKSLFEITMRRLYVAQITKYNLEEWYNDLEKAASELGEKKGFTAKTIWLPLSDEELKLMQSLASINLASSLGMNSRETQKEAAGREQLEDRISQAIKEDKERCGQPNKYYFCKMSTRSPKDGISARKANEAKDENEEEKDVAAQLQTKYNSLKVSDGYQVLGLLTRSQRIFSDISMYFQYRVLNSSSGQMCIILRDWMEGIRQDHEFRCFVHNKQLNAISQYHCYNVFPALQNLEHVNKIREAIVTYHNKIKDYIHLPSYVMDISVYDDYSCHVIELNPFGSHMSSGSALFSWKKDEDLMYGRVPQSQPSIRILKDLV